MNLILFTAAWQRRRQSSVAHRRWARHITAAVSTFRVPSPLTDDRVSRDKIDQNFTVDDIWLSQLRNLILSEN